LSIRTRASSKASFSSRFSTASAWSAWRSTSTAGCAKRCRVEKARGQEVFEEITRARIPARGSTYTTVAGATTLQVKLYSRFGTAEQRERMITLRLRERKDSLVVGEFEVPAAGDK
jgi:hypothetical protein